MGYELTGILLEKFKVIQRTATFKVREFVVERSEDINGKIVSNPIKFQTTQDRTSLLDAFKPGDRIQVSFNIRGSKWEKEGKASYFNNLDAWKIVAVPLEENAPKPSEPGADKGSDDFTSSEDPQDDSFIPF
ncbi:MAG: DUF3127 domain-containing protein [Chitinophagaceae bacterium]|nr:DUF3127 domain-containing protein [Chitinophagaceae bacterium]MCZ2397081.1 DUF3127 domain-containing protein [Chitinophagales bacterium]